MIRVNVELQTNINLKRIYSLLSFDLRLLTLYDVLASQAFQIFSKHCSRGSRAQNFDLGPNFCFMSNKGKRFVNFYK